ncbi:variable surface protein [Plasmodium gonderi]|uniref:Variable surface protein n=1 Tax=Plasmodium gonderi TaxID=77519 RepID=A0A1Y1JVY4_PLAGO|nr:variable surface protein [Plasmodium gonderi]GAW84513.1 variable surface protein [Plasmodium gonderi]
MKKKLKLMMRNLGTYDICNNYLKNLEEDTFLNLYFLEWLYYFLQVYENKGDISTCPMKILDYSKYLISLSECNKLYNNSFCDIINELQSSKSDYMVFISKCLKDAEPLAMSTEKSTIRVVLATLIVLFKILITVFIFYKVKHTNNFKKDSELHYFNYFRLYLQRILRNIRRLWFDNYNDYYILKDNFEMEYKNSIQNEYKLTYTSLGD